MKLQQLLYLQEIQRHQFNISKAAVSLCTSQSGISKQIQQLELELGVELFQRKGKQLIAFSVAGEKVFKRVEEALGKVDDVRLLAEELSQRNQSLSIATTHTQARYVLPIIVEKFVRSYPDINLHIHQGTPIQIAMMLEQGAVDIAIATEALSETETLVAMPCYQWSRSIVTQKDHPLAQKQHITLEDIIKFPIITYVQGFTGRHKVDEVFAKHHLMPDIVLSAVDADVIKTYVRLGLGIGIIANMAFNQEQDADLQALDAKALFGISTSRIAIKRDKYIKAYIFQFIEMFASHLTPAVVMRALDCQDNTQLQHLFEDYSVPVFQQTLFSN